jgi:tetratricopeptide (TPR) repeat protein
MSSVRLASEALNDIVIFYAEAGDYKEAFEYFNNVTGPKSAPSLYERLGNFYMDRGSRNKAAEIFKSLISRDPLSAKSFELQYKIVSMHSSAGNSQVFKEELFYWIERYGPGSAWQKANSGNKDLVTKAEMLAEATLRNYTLQNHQTAQNSRAKFSQDMAIKGYELYFSSFNKSPRIDEMHFFYAELLYDMKRYNDAAVHYVWVIDNVPQSAYFDQSLLNAILAVERQLPTNTEIKSIVGENTKPIEFDRTIRNFESLAKKLFQKSPQNPNNIQIKYKLGTLYYYYNQFPAALTAFNEVITMDSKSKYAEYSANLILDIYNLQKDYEGLESAADKLLSVPGLQTSSIGNQIKNIKQRSAFKRAENLESGNSFLEAGNSYLKFAKENPASDLVTSAYYNAGINFEKGLALASAISMYETVLTAKSKDKKNEGLAQNSKKFLGPLYEKVGKYKEAALAYEDFAKTYPKDKDSIDYQFNAAVLNEAMKRYDRAIDGYQKYLDSSKKNDRWDSLFYIAKIWEDRNKSGNAIKSYEQFLNSPSSNKSAIVESAFSIAELNLKLGKNAQASESYKKTIRIYNNFKKSGQIVGARFAAQAEFNLVYPTYSELIKLKIPADPAQQGKIVQMKLNLLNRLKEQLKAVVRYDDADQIVSALTLQGQGLQHMAAALFSTPLPKGLDAEQTKLYKSEVEKIAQPLKEQAIESYKAAITRGYSLGGYNQWLKQAVLELSKLVPGSYINHGEKVYYISRIDSMGEKPVENLNDLNETLSKDHKNLKALNSLGIYYLNKNESGLAKFAFQKALSFHSKESSLFNNIGVVELKSGDLRKAIVSFKQAASANPSYRPVQTNMSSILLDFSDYKSALGPVDESYNDLKGDLGPKSNMATQAASNYAVCLTGLGDFNKAKNIYEKILDTGVRDIDVMMNYAILLVKNMKLKADSIKILSKIKFASDDSQVLNRVKELEKDLDAI